jgi:hypothetical protein
LLASPGGMSFNLLHETADILGYTLATAAIALISKSA